MAGYWPSSFFACLWTKTESRSINSHRKNKANIQPSWPHAWLIKDLLLIWPSEKFLRDTAGNAERERQRHHPRTGSQSQRRIRFILPAHGASRIINDVILCSFYNDSRVFALRRLGRNRNIMNRVILNTSACMYLLFTRYTFSFYVFNVISSLAVLHMPQ